jgi:hypothetical protein
MSDQARSAELGISLRTLARVASSILAVGLVATAQARADAVADFYRGK